MRGSAICKLRVARGGRWLAASSRGLVVAPAAEPLERTLRRRVLSLRRNFGLRQAARYKMTSSQAGRVERQRHSVSQPQLTTRSVGTTTVAAAPTAAPSRLRHASGGGCGGGGERGGGGGGGGRHHLLLGCFARQPTRLQPLVVPRKRPAVGGAENAKEEGRAGSDFDYGNSRYSIPDSRVLI